MGGFLHPEEFIRDLCVSRRHLNKRIHAPIIPKELKRWGFLRNRLALLSFSSGNSLPGTAPLVGWHITQDSALNCGPINFVFVVPSAGPEPGVQCALSPVNASHPVQALMESFTVLSGCASRGTMGRPQEVHVLNLRAADQGPGQPQSEVGAGASFLPSAPLDL